MAKRWDYLSTSKKKESNNNNGSYFKLFLTLLNFCFTIVSIYILFLSKATITPKLVPTSIKTLQDNQQHILSNNPKPELRYLYINRHGGTSLDLQMVSEKLGFTFEELNPRVFTSYGQTNQRTIELNEHGNLGDFICDNYDVVFVGDVNTDARFLLKRILSSPSTCNILKVIMITTNRFDFMLKGPEKRDYLHLLNKVTTETGRVVWVANNPFDKAYSDKIMTTYRLDSLNYTVIRPLGYSILKAEPITPLQTKKVAMYSYPGINFSKILESSSVTNLEDKVEILDRQYGGPNVLKQYKGVLEIPYQTSTMKLYENLAHGVVSIIPTPRYLKQLKKDRVNFGGLYTLSPAFYVRYRKWYKLVEYYCDELEGFYYTFDSIDELKELLNSDILDTRNVAVEGPLYWEKVRQKSLDDWKHLLASNDLLPLQ